MDGLNPYHPFTTRAPEYYRSWTPTSVSPAHLVFYAPLRDLSYRAQRKIYFALDWLIVLACFVVIARIVQGYASRYVLLFVFATLLVYDVAFRLNLARGQSYLQLLLLAMAAATGLNKRGRRWLSALAFAVLLLFRPTYLITLAALFLLGYRSLVRRSLIAFGLLATVTVSFTGIDVWRSYGKMIHQQSDEHVQRAILGDDGVRRAPAVNERRPENDIEGVGTRNFLRLGGFEHDRTFLGLLTFHALHKRESKLPFVREAELRALNFALALLIACTGLYLAYQLRRCENVLVQIAFIFLLPIDIETFGPQRIAYADVLLAFPLILIGSSLGARLIREHDHATRPVAALVFAAFIFAASSRIHIGAATSALSVGRFFVALIAANLFCAYYAVASRWSTSVESSRERLQSLPALLS